MKKYFLFIFVFTLLLGCPQSLRAQTARCLKVTTNNVVLRVRPSAKSPLIKGYYNDKTVRLSKGEIVKFTGKRRNGFILVEECMASHQPAWDSGWISSKYVCNAKKCSNCRGKGFFNRICPYCEGEGHLCCKYSGRMMCKPCWGVGYK